MARNGKATTEITKKQVIDFFLNNKDNRTKTICKKFNLKETRVSRIISDYYDNKMNKTKEYGL